jgi:hypothetical protein
MMSKMALWLACRGNHHVNERLFRICVAEKWEMK